MKPEEDHLAMVVEAAAVRGPFDPLTLLPPDLTREAKQQVLRGLAHLVDEVQVDGVPRWVLKAEERRRVLSTLEDRVAAGKLFSRSSPTEDDAFAKALKSALTGRDSSSMPRMHQDAAYAARGFAAAAPYAAGRKSADSQALRRKIADEQEKARERVLLPHGLYGRDGVRAQVAAFLAGQLGRGALLLTGVGGIGKSALVSATIRDSLKQSKDRATVLLDFDRPNLFSAERIELAREITRQLGRQWPEAEKRLSEARARFPDAGSETTASLQTERLATTLSILKSALTDLKPGKVAVFLDTFEEIVVRGSTAVREVLNWMAALRDQGGLPELRVVVSGRAAPEMPADEFKRQFQDHIELSGLSDAAGARILREDAAGKALFDADRAKRASAALQGHPQALRLLRRYGEQHADEIDGIIAEGLENRSYGVQFAQVFLFTRILNRIRDPEVRQLAHPGLALRRVTPALIADVMAGPCDLGTMTPGRANDLFGRLKATAWIVNRTTDEAVVTHRQDLRQLMLPAMSHPDPKDPEKVKLAKRAMDIHRAAAVWYGQHRDATLSPEAQDLEAFYHRGWVAPKRVTMSEVERFAAALGLGIEELPARVQALGKVALGRTSSLTVAELALLPAAARERAVYQIETEALKRGETTKIRRKVSARPPQRIDVFADMSEAPDTSRPVPRTFAEAESIYGNEIQALWVEARFDEVVRVADLAFGHLYKNGSPETTVEFRGDPVYSAWWKSLLARSVTGVWPRELVGERAIQRIGELYPPDQTILGDSVGNNLSPRYLHEVSVSFANWPKHRAGLVRKSRRPVLPTKWSIALSAGYGRNLFALRAIRPAGDFFGFDENDSFLIRCSQLRVLVSSYAELLLRDNEITAGIQTTMADPDLVRRLDWLAFPRAHDLQELKPIRASMRGASNRFLPLEQIELLIRELDPAVATLSGKAFVFRDPRLLQRMNEVLDPMVHTLTPLASTADGLVALAGVSRLAALWPQEMTPESVAKTRPEQRADVLGRIVQFADQADLLPDLMRIARDVAPDDAGIRAVSRLVDRVEEIFNLRPPEDRSAS